MINKILIGAGITVVAAGAAIGILFMIRNMQQPSANTNIEKPFVVLDFSKDYGACDLLETSVIIKNLGDSAKNLQNPENMGIVSNKPAGNNVEDLKSDSQLCIYAFGPGGTLENGFNSSDAFIVEKTVYSNERGTQSLIDQIVTNGASKVVDDVTLGDRAFYSAADETTGPSATASYNLEIFTDKTSVNYMIRQPADSTSFTDESAKTALISLAKLAK